MDSSAAAVGSGAETDAGAEHKAQSVPSTAHTNSAAERRRSAPVRFKIRTAQERALFKQAENQQGQNELHRLWSLREGERVNAKGEERKTKQMEKPAVEEAGQVSVVSTKGMNDTQTGLKPNSRTNRPETQNVGKLTEMPKPVNGQTKPDSRMGQLQPASGGFSTHTHHSENWTVHRGRPQWRRVNAPTRSKSLDWRGESSTDEGKLWVQTFSESHTGRRAESLERGGRSVVDRTASASEEMNPTPNTVMSTVKMYNSSDKAEEKTLLGGCSDVNAGPEIRPLKSNIGLSVKKGSGCQSLPSRLKSGQSGASEDRYAWKCNPYDSVSNPRVHFGSGTTEPLNGTAGRVFAKQSILNRIEKLYGSSNSGAGLDHDEVKRNCDGAKDYNIANRQHLWHGDTWRNTINDVQWRSMTHKGQNGGTFPRRSSEGNNFGTVSRDFGKEKDEQKVPISTQGNSSVFQQSKEACTAEPRASLTDIEGSVCKQPQLASDTSHNRISMYEQQRCLRAKPGNNHAALLRDPSLSSSLVRGKEERGREMEKEDREEDCKIQRKSKKEGGKVQSVVQNEGKEMEAEEWMQVKPLKVVTVNDRSPTARLSTATDSPVLPSPSVSQVAFSAAGKLKEEPKADMAGHPGGKMECIQPSSKSLRKEDKGVSEEHGPMKDQETKLSSANSGDNLSTDSVRNKIHRFEALALRNQASQLPPLRSRRAWSLQEQSRDVAGQMMTKSGLDKSIGGVKEKEKNVLHKEQRESGRLPRSFSLADAGQSREGRYKDFWESDNTFKTQFNRGENASLQTTITQARPHESLKSNSAEPSSFNVSHPDVKKAVTSQQEICHPSKVRTPHQQTNCTKRSGPSRAGENDDIATRSASDSASTSRTSTDKAVCSSSNNDKAGGTKSSCASERECHVSENTKDTSGPVPSTKPLLSGVNGAPGTFDPSGSPSRPSHVLSQQSDGSSASLHRHNDTAPVDEGGSVSSFSVCMARSSSEAGDLKDKDDDDDDDDDNSTEKADDSNYESDSGESSVTITSNTSQSDHKSFSVTLADLCNFGGVDYASRDDLDEDSEDCASHRTASLSSNISAFSTVSLLTTEELDSLICDVRNLGDETLQSYEDVQVVVLHKEAGCGLGFTVAGGVDQNKAITVHKVFPGGLAAREGSIQEGDEVLSINGTALRNCAHWEALRTLRRARARSMAVVVLQKGTVKQLQKAQKDYTVRTSDLDSKVNEGRILRVMLNKSGTELGFSLEGGLDSSVGDTSITVKKVFQGGPVNEVSPGDELLEIAGHNLHGLRRLEVWNLIKTLPPGPVEVVLNRPFKGKRERLQKASQL